MKKVRLSKSLRKAMKKGTEKFVNELYFNPKRRKEIRRDFVKSRDGFLKILSQPTKANPTYAEAENRGWADVFADQTSRMVDVIDKTVPQKLKEFELVNLYVAINRIAVILAMDAFRNKHSYFVPHFYDFWVCSASK